MDFHEILAEFQDELAATPGGPELVSAIEEGDADEVQRLINSHPALEAIHDRIGTAVVTQMTKGLVGDAGDAILEASLHEGGHQDAAIEEPEMLAMGLLTCATMARTLSSAPAETDLLRGLALAGFADSLGTVTTEECHDDAGIDAEFARITSADALAEACLQAAGFVAAGEIATLRGISELVDDKFRALLRWYPSVVAEHHAALDSQLDSLIEDLLA